MLMEQKSVSYWDLTRYFAPLALQAASQAFSYPLVAMVASRGPGGTANLAGLAQSNIILFFIGVVGFGMVTTGMVYGKTREGFNNFFILTMLIGVFCSLAQTFLCIPSLSGFLFGHIIGLPPSIEAPAAFTLLATIPLQFLFFLRIPYQVAMYNGRQTGKASIATIVRIIFTALLSFISCMLGLVGPLWAVACLTLPVALEVVGSWFLSRHLIKDLASSMGSTPGISEIFKFNLPLTIGGYFLALVGITIGGFIARAPDPERMIPVFYLALGLVSPVAYATTRLQAVAIAFLPVVPSRDKRIFWFTLFSGLVLGLLPLLFILPWMIDLYYVKLQQLAPGDIGLIRLTALSLVIYPVGVALRSHWEGMAALDRKPFSVLVGQVAFMITVLISAFITLYLGAPGYIIGTVALTIGGFISAVVTRRALVHGAKVSIPVPQTTTSYCQK